MLQRRRRRFVLALAFLALNWLSYFAFQHSGSGREQKAALLHKSRLCAKSRSKKIESDDGDGSECFDYTSPRLYLEHDELQIHSTIELQDEHFQYLGKVLRLREGSKVRVFNEKAGEIEAEFLPETRNNRVVGGSLKLSTVLRLPPQPDEVAAAAPWLVFAPIKPKRQRVLVEKACELGAGALWPVHTRRTTAKLTADNREDKIRAVLVEAAEQCERLDVPALRPAAPSLAALLAAWPAGRTLLVCRERGGGGARPLLEELRAAFPGGGGGGGGGPPLAPGFLVGPEGGWAPEELELLERAAAAGGGGGGAAAAAGAAVRAVSLGPRVLRAETAAAAALACWDAHLGEAAGRRL